MRFTNVMRARTAGIILAALLVVGAAIPHARSAPAGQGAATLRSTAAAQSLSPEEAGRGPLARIDGVVTFSHPLWRIFFIQDSTGGIFCDPLGLDETPKVGHRVAIDGYVVSGSYLPYLTVQRLDDQGEAPVWPSARPVTGKELFDGRYDADLVKLTGYVSSAQVVTNPLPMLIAIVESDGFPVEVRLFSSTLPDPKSLPFAYVEAEGVYGPVANRQRQIQQATLSIARRPDFRVLRDPDSVLKNLPLTPIPEFWTAAKSPSQETGLVRTRGSVSVIGTNEIYLTSAGNGIRVDLPSEVGLRLGEEVEIGALRITSGPEVHLKFVHLVTRTNGLLSPPTPMAIEALGAWRRYGSSVQIEGEFLHRSPDPSGTLLVLRDQEHSCEVQIRFSPVGAVARLAAGSRVRASGILRLLPSENSEHPLPRILVASPEGLTVLTRPPWPLARTLIVVSILSGALAIGLIALGLAHRRLHLSNRRVERAELELRRLNGELAGRIHQRTAELAFSEARFRSAIEHSFECVVMSNSKGQCTYISPSIARILGYAPQELLRLPLTSFVWPEDRGKAERYYQDLRQTADKHAELEIRARHQDGSCRWIQTSDSNQLQDPNVQAIVSNLRDVTEQKEAGVAKESLEVQLRQSQKMEAIGTLAGGIAHDFNNILGIIIGQSELAHQELPAGSSASIHLNQVLAASRRAKELVRQILTFSRREKFQRTVLNVEATVNEALGLLRATLPPTVEVVLSILPPIPWVRGNRTLIQQIVVNLTTNAAQAIGHGPGRVNIELREHVVQRAKGELRPDLPPGRYLKLSVQDDGPGIPLPLVERIFEPFFTTKGPGEGTGLGLSVVHGIVQSHEGSISVTSDPGRGTTFHILLPATLDRDLPLPPSKPLPPSLIPGSERILLIDDEPSLLNIGEQVLRNSGYRVRACLRPNEALDAFRRAPQEFDLIITDYSMPELSGLELASSIRQLRKDIPMLICTGYGAGLTTDDARSMGFHDVLQKPLEIAELSRAVRTALDDTLTPR